jgi:serine/threonine protein kinase
MGSLSECCGQAHKRQREGQARLEEGRGTGLRVEDFQSLQTLGSGKFGTVQKVRKVDSGQVYAMKIISKSKLA